MRSGISQASTGLLVFLLAVSICCEAQYSRCESDQQAVEARLHKIENEWPMRGSGDAVSRYVQKLGVKLAHANVYGRNISWHFSVVRNLAPNAFSIGGGYVFITDGAVNFARNEAELAAILAHEIGHELAGHFCEPVRPNDFDTLFDIFFAPEHAQHHVGIGSMTQIIDPVKERQADQIGISILQESGFNPHAMLDVAGRLPLGGAIHFSASSRVRFLAQAVAGLPPKPTHNSEAFRLVKRLLAGE